MNRRTFTQSLAAAAMAAASPQIPASTIEPSPRFGLSVMLWTVFTDLPFEQRLAKVAEAGYSNIELVGEYHAHNWSDADFARANAARKALGISFDATAGLHNGDAVDKCAGCDTAGSGTGPDRITTAGGRTLAGGSHGICPVPLIAQ